MLGFFTTICWYLNDEKKDNQIKLFQHLRQWLTVTNYQLFRCLYFFCFFNKSYSFRLFIFSLLFERYWKNVFCNYYKCFVEGDEESAGITNLAKQISMVGKLLPLLLTVFFLLQLLNADSTENEYDVFVEFSTNEEGWILIAKFQKKKLFYTVTVLNLSKR